MVTSTATLAMALHDHHDHIAEMKNHSHNAEMEGMVKTIREDLKDNITRELKDNITRELNDNITRFRLSNFTFCVGVAI